MFSELWLKFDTRLCTYYNDSKIINFSLVFNRNILKKRHLELLLVLLSTDAVFFFNEKAHVFFLLLGFAPSRFFVFLRAAFSPCLRLFLVLLRCSPFLICFLLSYSAFPLPAKFRFLGPFICFRPLVSVLLLCLAFIFLEFL